MERGINSEGKYVCRQCYANVLMLRLTMQLK
nr:MAG TPA: hypothetical protein [Caudoviricetes sp.]